jgi:hypothetical protein
MAGPLPPPAAAIGKGKDKGSEQGYDDYFEGKGKGKSKGKGYNVYFKGKGKCTSKGKDKSNCKGKGKVKGVIVFGSSSSSGTSQHPLG